LGLDLTTAITLFLKQAVREQAIPFEIKRDMPNAETIAAMNEFYEMQAHS
jgi:DNA-damage-inducible protein J